MDVSRVLPGEVQHPRQYMTLSAAEFSDLPKQQMEVGPTLAPGHKDTVIFYSDGEVRGYIVQVNFDRGPSEYFLLPCSFEPKFGIDQFDGMLIEDTEEFSLVQRLGLKTNRLDVFGKKEAIDTRSYLQQRTGALPKPDNAERAAQANEAFRTASSILMPFLQKSDGRAITHSEAASLKRANDLFAQVLEKSPENSSAMWLSGKAFQLLNQPEYALRLFIRAAETTPQQKQFAMDAGMLACELGNGPAAIQFCQQALNSSPSDPELMSNLALALLIGGDAGRAEILSAKALQIKHPSQNVTRRVNGVCAAVAAKKYPCPRNQAEVIQIAKKLKI